MQQLCALGSRKCVRSATFPSIFRGDPGLPSGTRLDSVAGFHHFPERSLGMAGNINRVIITGNLTRDPELSTLPASGTAVCSLRVACNGRRKNNDTNQWEDQPNYFDVTVWGAQGENCASSSARDVPWRSTDGCAGANGRQAKDKSARLSISSLNPCSSSAGAMTPVMGTGSPAAHARRRAMFRSTPAISRPLPYLPELPTTTFRSEAATEQAATVR